ncbi:hypothetical protein V6N12_000861 [Hibiscus sabdariffa]|uniref:Uncharacterized protein n=1 Tax=Hibiscus sabdariffa TaxID=183260 RepID=A0ABR2BXN0_9ROSI
MLPSLPPKRLLKSLRNQNKPTAVVVASPAVLVVGQWAHTFSFTANLGIATLLSTLPTVEFVRFDVYTYFVAAKGARTAPHFANFRASVACEDRTRFLAEKSTCSSKRGCHLTIRRRKMRSFTRGGGDCNGCQGHNHGQHKEKLEEVHVFPNMELSLGRKVVLLEIRLVWMEKSISIQGYLYRRNEARKFSGNLD